MPPPTAAPDDWRRQGQERHLLGATLAWRAYQPPSAQWDLDHCQFCGAKFSPRPGDLASGYCTLQGDRWVCETCVADFRQEFRWALLGGPR